MNRVVLGLLAGVFVAPGVAAWAQTPASPASVSPTAAPPTKPAPGNLPVLLVGPLVNRGGAAVLDPDGTPLYVGFARALAVAMKGEEKNTPLPFTVAVRDTTAPGDAPPPDNPKPERAAPPLAPNPAPGTKGAALLPPSAPNARFRLEGEISVAGTDGPYLCVLRLVDNGGKGVVAAQWAGVAQTLRDLTGNLGNDKRISPLGLAGEFARRATVTAKSLLAPSASAATADFEKRVTDAAKTNRLTLEAVPDGSKPNGDKNAAMGPGAKFRVRVSTQDAGDVYLFRMDKQNAPVAAYEQKAVPVALPGRPVLLPPSGAAFSVGADGPPTFVAVLVRRADVAQPAPSAQPASAAVTLAAPIQNPDDALGAAPNNNLPAVLVLDASARLPEAPADALVARLLALLETKKPDEVLSARLTAKPVK